MVTDVVDGFHIDAGANVFLESYGTVRQVAAELGVPMQRTRLAIHGGVYHNGKFHGSYGGDRLNDRLRTAWSLLSLQLLSPVGLLQALKFFRLLRSRSKDLSFDDASGLLDVDRDESVTEFFESKIGTEFYERFVQPNLSSYALGYPEQIGMAFVMIAAWNFAVSWPYMPERGLGHFMDALAGDCNANLRLSTPVRRIVLEDGVAKGVITDDGFVEADAVICATTATVALNLLPGLPSAIGDVLRRVGYSRCCRVVFGTHSNPFPNKDWYAVAFPRTSGTLMTGMSDSAVLIPKSVPEGKALIDAFVIGEQADELFALGDAEIGERVLRDIRRFTPAMKDPLFTRVYRWQEAVCLLAGGMMNELHNLGRQGLDEVKGLFLAGEYMGVPSTNGALRSGLNAAGKCADSL